jgi:hypothetical protein
MRNALRGEAKIDEFLDKLNKTVVPSPGAANNSQTPAGESNQNQNTQENNPKAISLDDVEEILTKREQAKRETDNLAYTAKKVKEAFGANYAIVLQQKAADLGVTPEYLTQVAKSQPAAFLKLVEADKAANTQGSPPRSSVNTSGMGGNRTDDRNQAYYNNLRKQIGDAQYFSPKVQNELHKDAQRLGEAFFN